MRKSTPGTSKANFQLLKGKGLKPGVIHHDGATIAQDKIYGHVVV